MGWMIFFLIISVVLSGTMGAEVDYYVGENEVQSFAGVPTDPACGNVGVPIPNFVICTVPAGRLTDNVLGDNSPVNFTQFSAWNRASPMPRIYFRFNQTSPITHIRQMDMYFFKSSSLRIGLPDIRIHISGIVTNDESVYFSLPYTIIRNQSISEGENQTVKVSLVDTIDQPFQGYLENKLVRLTFNFSGSDALDWMLLSEIKLFNAMTLPIPQGPINFQQDQVTRVSHGAIDLVSSERLTCSVANEVAFEWIWTGPIGANTSMLVADLTHTGVLQISSLSLSDAGNYTCIVSYLSGDYMFQLPKALRAENSSIINLQLNVTTSGPVTATANNGSNASLSCEFSGYLPHGYSISWENWQGGSLNNHSKYTIVSSAGTRMVQSGGSSPTRSVVSTLTIISVLETDEGSYTCRMSGGNSAQLMGTIQLSIISFIMRTTNVVLVNTPTMTPSVPTDGLNTVTAVLISVVVLLCVALAIVLLGIVLFLTLQKKKVSSKQAAPAIGVDTLSGIYEEVDEGMTGTAVALRNVSKLQPITEPDPTYEAMDDSELESKRGPLHVNVPTDSNAPHGVTTIPSSDMRTGPNPAYGVTPIPTSDVPTASNAAYGVSTIPAVGTESATGTQQLRRVDLNEDEEEDYI